MRGSEKMLSKMALLFGVALVLQSSHVLAQNGSSRSSKKRSWVTAKQAKEAKAKEGVPELTKYELKWATIDTHQSSRLEVFGKQYKHSTEFENGDAPYFNAFEEELEPGKYTYAITFVPNELGEYKTAMSDIRSQRTDLAKRRREAIEAGRRDLAKTIYQRSNELRKEAADLSSQHMTAGAKPAYEFIKKQGQFVVDEDGSIKVYDLKKVRQQARDAAREKQEEERAQNREDEESEGN